MSYIFLILTLLSAFSIAVLLRVFEHKQGNRTVVIASNYIVALLLSFTLMEKTSSEPMVIISGAVLGLLFFGAFVVYSTAIKTKGIASSVTIGRLALAIPVGLSIFLWGEKPLLLDLIALLLVFIIIITWESKIGKVAPILLLLFVLFGINDAIVKYFKLKFPQTDESFFLIMVFGSALVWSWLYVLFTKQTVTRRDIFRGLLLGVPNYTNSYFLILALGSIPGYITFPFVSIGAIVLSSLTGYFFFKEELNKKKVFLIMLGIAAVLILAT